jgi:transglutaminase-like putative cysteine protease
MTTIYETVPDGLAGVELIVTRLNQYRELYGRLPGIRAAAVQILDRLNIGESERDQVEGLAYFVRTSVRYVCDPLNAELFQTPDRMLLDIAGQGYTRGDCDDHALLFASLAEAIGIPCEIVAVNTGGALPDHVVVVAQISTGPETFDLVQK